MFPKETRRFGVHSTSSVELESWEGGVLCNGVHGFSAAVPQRRIES